MALNLPGGLFEQSDVRETATKSSDIQYWSCAGAAFKAEHPNSDDVSYLTPEGNISTDAGITTDFFAPVYLPNGALVLKAIVWTSDAITWTLRRIKLDDNWADTLASGSNESENTTISFPTIDNSQYAYFLHVTGISGAGEVLAGARISYTLQQ